jgi:predicted Ser/Thr protein kinase
VRGKRFKRYEILGKIGSGSMATVYRAREISTGRLVALKLMHPHLADDPAYIARFRREAQTAKSLDNPHIVKMLDYGEEKGEYFLVMEYVRGRTLQQLIQERRSLTTEQALHIAWQVAKALDAAHRQGIVHRDIKPQNLMVTPEGLVKVLDFGIAKAADFSTITQTGVFMGSPHYVSPEQAKGARSIDIRSDLYSLGVVLYHMLTGVPPFDAETPWTVLHQHVEGEPVPVHRLRVDVPTEVEGVVQKAMAREPAARYQTPAEMVKALEGLGAGKIGIREEVATIAGPLPVVRDVGVARRPIPTWAVAGAITVVLLLILGVLTVGRPPPPPVDQIETAIVVTPPDGTAVPVRTESPGGQPAGSHTVARTATSTRTPTLTPTDTVAPTSTATATSVPVPTPVERMIESFESYANDRALRAAYSINAPENDAFVSLATGPNVHRGSQALAFTYHIHTIVPAGGSTVTDYAGFARDFPSQDWRGFNYLTLWVRSDGSNKDLVIQFHEASGEVWKHTTNLSGFRDKNLELVFDRSVFYLAEWTPSVNNRIDLGSITGLSIYVGHGGTGQGTIYVDAIRLVE